MTAKDGKLYEGEGRGAGRYAPTSVVATVLAVLRRRPSSPAPTSARTGARETGLSGQAGKRARPLRRPPPQTLTAARRACLVGGVNRPQAQPLRRVAWAAVAACAGILEPLHMPVAEKYIDAVIVRGHPTASHVPRPPLLRVGRDDAQTIGDENRLPRCVDRRVFAARRIIPVPAARKPKEPQRQRASRHLREAHRNNHRETAHYVSLLPPHPGSEPYWLSHQHSPVAASHLTAVGRYHFTCPSTKA